MPKEFDPFDDDPEEGDDENSGEGNFNPEEFFNEQEYDDDPVSDEEFRKELEAYRDTPIFKSAERIRKLTTLIVETFDEEKDQFMMKSLMLENAMIIGAKIAGAEGVDTYTLRMENAVVIKIHARELLAQTSFCRAEKLCNQEYLQLLRDEIEEFKKLFVQWVNSFDKLNDEKDDWGLFYD